MLPSFDILKIVSDGTTRSCKKDPPSPPLNLLSLFQWGMASAGISQKTPLSVPRILFGQELTAETAHPTLDIPPGCPRTFAW